jgi:hypothetical protein
MACVRSTARPRDNAPMQEGECAIVERGAIDEGRDSVESVENTESVCMGDTVSQSSVEVESDGGSHTRSCYFSPSMVTESRFREMSD